MTFTEIIESLIAAGTIAVLLPLNPLFRRQYNRRGATDAEVSRPYPSDSRVPRPRQEYTRAITIHAPASLVWAYLIQLGQERAGMYSYDLLENLGGCQMHTVDRIVPEWQTIQIGDTVRFGPKEKSYPVQTVVAVEPGYSLVLAGADPKTAVAFEPTDPTPAQYVNASWAFYLEAVDSATTRLVTRSRLDHSGGTGMFLIWRITEVLNFVMEQKTLRAIKQYAERDARQSKLQTELSPKKSG